VADPEAPIPSEPGERNDPDEARGVELWLAPFFRDSTLWPVLTVAIAILVLFGAWALLLVFVDRNLFALGAVLAIFWMSVDVVVRSRRGGGSALLLGCVAGFWLLSTAAAVGAHRSGW
jgi:hypothetical protein